jgi:hypothetical protein
LITGQAEMQATLIRADNGYLYLVILTAVLVLAGTRMRRWPWVSSGLKPAVEWVQQPHPLLWIVLGGALMRVPRLFDSFWYDEVFTARLAGLPIEQLGAAVRGDVHPPLWYVIDWAAARVFGMSEPALRLPAFVFGVLLIVYAYRLAKVLGLNERTALVYAALIAVLPAALYYSAEARGYSLLALLAFGALIGVLEDRPWVYLAHAALLPLVHNIGYVYLAVFTVLYLSPALRASPLRARRGARFAFSALALLPGLLWLPTMLAQSGDIVDGFWLQPINLGLALSVVTDMSVTRAIHTEFVAVVMVIAIGATLVGLASYWRWMLYSPRGRAYSALVIGVPVLLALAAWLWAPVYLTRALLPVGLGLALLWAMLLVHKPLSRLAIPVAIGLALVSFYTPGLGRFNMRAAVDECMDAASVYVTSIPAALFASYYLPQAELRVWAEAGDLNQTLQRDAMAAMGLQVGTFTDLARPACLLMLDTSQTREDERDYVAHIGASAPHTLTEYWVNQFYSVRMLQF